MRMALIRHVVMARSELLLDGPSNTDPFITHMYSLPERLTPWRCTVSPAAFSMWFPTTCRPVIGGPTGSTGPENAALGSTPHPAVAVAQHPATNRKERGH